MVPNQSTYDPYQHYKSSRPNLRMVLYRYRNYWKWFALSLLLFLGAGLLLIYYLPPVYSIQASLLIKDEKKGSSEESALKEQNIFIPKKVVENEMEVLRSTMMMDKVVGDLGLDVQYFVPRLIGKREIFDTAPIRFTVEKARTEDLYDHDFLIHFSGPKTVVIDEQVYPVGESIQTPFGQVRVAPRDSSFALSKDTPALIVRATERDLAVSEYIKNLEIVPTSKASTVLMLSLEESVPSKGKALLTRLIDEYNQAAIEDKNRVAANTLKFIEERLKLISNELATIEKNIETYKSVQGITDLGIQAQAFLKTVQENDAQINQVRIQMAALTNMEKYVAQKKGERGLAPNTLGLNDPVLLGLVTKLNELELQRDKLARTVNESNPMLQTLDTQITAVKSGIRDNIATMRATLTGTQRQLWGVNNRTAGMIRRVPTKDRVLLNITRQQTIKNNLYTYLLQKREEAALSYAATVSDSRVIDLAHSTVKPVKPKKKIIMALAGLLGLILPIGLAVGKEVLNDKVTRFSDVENGTTVPIIGEIMESKNAKPLVLLPAHTQQSQSLISEQIRMLRTNVQFLNTGIEGGRVILVTSSVSGEGKSFLSSNLGASLALADHPTVVLEMDLRRPRISAALSVVNDEGITEYLTGEARLDAILKPVSSFDNYWIITSGHLPPNPSEVIGSYRLGELLQELRKRFAYIIIDTSPISLVTDAHLIAPHVDATLFIVRSSVTPKMHLKALDGLLREQRFPGLHVVLNGADGKNPYYTSYAAMKRSTQSYLNT